jgi:hypothetical protein
MPAKDADEALRNGSPFDAIVHLFPSRERAAMHYASHKMAQYPLANVRGACVICGGTASVRPAEFRWKGFVSARAVVAWLGIPLAAILVLLRGVTFSTFHSLCPTCQEQIERILTRRTFTLVGSALLLLGIVLVIVGVSQLSQNLRGDDVTHFRVVAASGVTACVLGSAAMLAARRFRSQPALSRIVSPPFELQDVVRPN